MKKIYIFSILILIAVILSILFLWPLRKKMAPQKYQSAFTDVFDTTTTIIGYANDKNHFAIASDYAHNRLKELHSYFDIYHTYGNNPNLKTINDNAGITPVNVPSEIIELLLLSKEAYVTTQGTVNIAMGGVLALWHESRENFSKDPAMATIPDYEELKQAAQHTDINNIIINEENQTIYLADPAMSIDAGAIAKGYAAEIVTQELKDLGYDSIILSLGGNVRAMEAPLDKETWTIGVQDAFKTADGIQNILDTIYANNISVVSSGDYQRYFIANGQRYNHIIDPATFFPADKFKQVTILMEDSTQADIYATALFILPFDEGKAVIERAGGEALWVFHDGTIKYTDGYTAYTQRLQ